VDVVTVSSRFRIKIPESIRNEFHIHPGSNIAFLVKHGVVQLVPARPLSASKGMFRGTQLDQSDLRDHSDRY
jgi:AbrB family looped-hinge helix DNA binding protein